ncbi:ABC transporter permease [Granulicoccus sp. GXG6511]|uniref:ABC transporter permease n=1 Tax=Granulicoccus sp. GXG6511 TaxID=3381351 RepID=UPI003D7C9D9B
MIRLLARRHRLALIAWVVGLLSLVAITAPSYEATYGDPESRVVLVEQLQATQGSKVLYGELPDPGTLGQLFAWETGSYIVILAAVMAVLLAISMTRGEEDAGTLELVRSVGVRPGVPLGSAIAVLAGACAAVGGGSALILLAQTATISELTVEGALAYGAVAFLAPLCCGLWAVICAQLRPDARSARGWAFAAVALGFGERVIADFGSGWWADALQWLTPFGWKTVVGPYTEDRFWALAPIAVITAAFGAVGVLLARRRELGSALVAGAQRSGRGLRVRTPEGWAWVSARGSIAGWSLAILGTAGLFGSMADGLVTTIATDPATGELMNQLGGPADPAAAYFNFLGTFIALLVMICGVVLVLRFRGEETSGRLVHELATGVRRWRALLARVLVAVVVSVGLLAASGVLMGLIGEAQLDEGEPMAYAVSASLGEAPGLLLCVGLTALLVGLVPRWASAIWLIVAWSGFTVLFGALVDLPAWAVDLSLLGHAPSGDGLPDWKAWLGPVPIGLGLGAVVGIAAATALVGRRDLRLG